MGGELPSLVPGRDEAGSDSTLRITHVAPGYYAFGHVANVALQFWGGQADGAAALALRELARQLHGAHPDGISSIHWLCGASDLPTADARHQFVALMRDYGVWLGEPVMVVDGSGFWASAVRAMLTGLRLTAGSRMGFRVAASVEEVCRWLAEEHRERTGTSVGSVALLAGLQQLRARCGT